MKKIFLLIVISILVTGLVFAQNTADVGKVRNAKDTGLKKTGAAKPELISAQPNKGFTECMQELLKKQPNTLRQRAQAICNYRIHQKLTLANRAQAVRTANVEGFVELHKGKLEAAVEKCETDECKTKIRSRVQKVEKLSEVAKKRLQNLEKSRLKKVQALSAIKAKPEFVKYAKTKEGKARIVAKEKIQTAKTNFLRAKEKFLDVRKNYKEAKLRFQEVKKKVTECGDEEIDECVKSKEEIRTKAKEQLAKSAESVLEHLNKLKSRIGSSEHLDEADVSDMLARVDEKITAVEEIKNKIDVAETKEEIKEAAKELRQLWAKSKVKLREHAARMVNSKIGGIIVKSKQLEVKLEKVLTRMTENGIDTTVLQTQVDEFNALIEKARSNYELAVGKFKEAKKTDTPDSALIQEAQKYMKDAHSSLKDAQQKLREIVLSIKETGGEEELNEPEPEEEAEEGGE